MSPKDVLTAEEVAKHLRIHPYTVRRLVRDGKLPGFKVGGQWRFNRTEMDAFMNSKNQGKRKR